MGTMLLNEITVAFIHSISNQEARHPASKNQQLISLIPGGVGCSAWGKWLKRWVGVSMVTNHGEPSTVAQHCLDPGHTVYEQPFKG